MQQLSMHQHKYGRMGEVYGKVTLLFSVLCIFPGTAYHGEGPSHLQSVLKSVLFKENLVKLQPLCPSCFSLQSHVHTYCNYQHETICLCVRCPRRAAHLASVKEKYFNGKHRTCESSNWKTLEERAKLKA